MAAGLNGPTASMWDPWVIDQGTSTAIAHVESPVIIVYSSGGYASNDANSFQYPGQVVLERLIKRFKAERYFEHRLHVERSRLLGRSHRCDRADPQRPPRKHRTCGSSSSWRARP